MPTNTEAVNKSFTAWLTINRACNLRCKWCYAKTTGFAERDMTIETVEEAITLLQGLNVRNVFLIGGEPTIHPRFLEIVTKLSESGLRPMLISNGVAFYNASFLQKAINAGLLGITMSLKASSPSQYRFFTGRDCFNKAIQAIRNVEEKKALGELFFRVSVTVCHEMFDSIGELVKLLKRSGVTEFSIDTERPIFMNGKPKPVEGVTPREMVSLLVLAYPILNASGIKFSIRLSLPYCLYPPEFVSEIREKGQILSGCQLIAGSGIILDTSGKLIPCNHLCEYPLGKLGEDFSSGKEFIGFREREDVGRFYRAMRNCPNELCQKCDQWTICGGGCRVYWFNHGENELLH